MSLSIFFSVKRFTCKGWGHSYRECPSGPAPQFWWGGRGGGYFRHGHGGHRGREGGKTTNNGTLKFF